MADQGDRTDTSRDAALDSWPAHVGAAVVTGLVTTYLPVQRWSRPARWALHGGLGAMTAVAVGLSPSWEEKTATARKRAAVAMFMGAAVTGASRGGQSADAWAEGGLARRGVRRPRLWMGIAAAGASLAMSASDRRRAVQGPA